MIEVADLKRFSIVLNRDLVGAQDPAVLVAQHRNEHLILQLHFG